jgi:hypothetical protein
MRPALACFVPLLLLTACASGPEPTDDGGAAASTSSSASGAPADDELVVELDRGAGDDPDRYTLTCADPVAGDLPDPVAACVLLQGLGDPFEPVPPDAMCTEQHGGPQTARVTGRWAGQPVDLQLSRTDGCRIAQWDRLGPLLPGPVG